MKKKVMGKEGDYEHLWKTWPVFWKDCKFCDNSFRWESGWYAVVSPWLGGRGHPIYICNACAKTRREAAGLILDRHKIYAEPEPPIPQPPPGIVGEDPKRATREFGYVGGKKIRRSG